MGHNCTQLAPCIERKQDPGLESKKCYEEAPVLDPLPGDLLYGWIFFRLIIQPIAAPAANTTAMVSIGYRCKRLFVL
jgi:hypothetical protein